MTPAGPKGGAPQIRTVYSGAWLHYRVAEYRDAGGRLHQWEYVDRTGRRPGALMMTVCQPSGDLILVRQYRAALGADAVEFPAGLVDEGETPAEAALRELREETGYQGRVVAVSPALGTSSGLTSEQIYLVGVEVDETAPENQSPQPSGAEREQIDLLRVSLSEARQTLTALANEGVVVDSRVWAWITVAPGMEP